MFEEYLDFAVGMAREAGRIQLSYFRGDDLAMKTKSNVSDVVTCADRESEELIVWSILERYPTHAILGEEGGARGDAASEWRWVVDPLDGTTNYSQGLPVFCVSIALQYRGETVVGVVYAPYLRELFTAVRGGGAWCRRGDGEPVRLHVSTKQRLDCSVVATGFPYDKSENPDNNSDNVARILPHVRDVRRMGGCGLRPVVRGGGDARRFLGAEPPRVGCLRGVAARHRGRRRCRVAARRPRRLARGGQCGTG